MKPVLDMTPAEAIEESTRREDRKRRGLHLHESPAEIEAREIERREENDSRLEKEIQADIRKLFLAFGCQVYNLSQARASRQTPGLGDLVVFHPRTKSSWWFETKTPCGVVSADQIVFHELCEGGGWVHVIGGKGAAETHLITIGAAYRDSSGSLEPKF